MRKVILFIHLSFDGCVAGAENEQDWMTRTDDEMGAFMADGMVENVDTILTGRKLYEGFAQFWPGVPAMPNIPPELVAFAHWMNDTRKVVFSKTLDKAEWTNSVIASGDVADEITKLKAQPGKDMVIFGGAEMVQELTKRGLVDEYHIKLEPVILGNGKPLFKEVTDRVQLKLIKSKAFEKSGVVGLFYEVVR
ncbi:dihydrofolate reductase [Mucilaginibacter yixingensis]|uniref:Dihydrofolate reductase n=1 Tax=Mucilaginibacter yixingensis TaxID=1295612 RepID=A0A2T5JE27_9SPHI|nr:dihydrofolate reductase family protein [Mucilaginibacter yixingensis]PTR00027.1 dihydrofolate reductase [Mucilaginibacter yixingensis]